MSTDRAALTLETYPQEFVRTTHRTAVLAYLDQLRAVLSRGSERVEFPEGAIGLVLHAMLSHEAGCCPDAGDFVLVREAFESAITASYNSLARSFDRR